MHINRFVRHRINFGNLGKCVKKIDVFRHIFKPY